MTRFLSLAFMSSLIFLPHHLAAQEVHEVLVMRQAIAKPKPQAPAAPITPTGPAEATTNSSFKNDLSGWTAINAAWSDGKAVLDSRPYPDISYLLQEFQVENGKSYNLKVDYTSLSPSCTHPHATPLAIYRYPYGRSGGVKGTFVHDPFQICNYAPGIRTATFTANYTGVADIVFWVEPTAGNRIKVEIEEISVVEAN